MQNDCCGYLIDTPAIISYCHFLTHGTCMFVLRLFIYLYMVLYMAVYFIFK